jgi:hypothetical protein
MCGVETKRKKKKRKEKKERKERKEGKKAHNVGRGTDNRTTPESVAQTLSLHITPPRPALSLSLLA